MTLLHLAGAAAAKLATVTLDALSAASAVLSRPHHDRSFVHNRYDRYEGYAHPGDD